LPAPHGPPDEESNPVEIRKVLVEMLQQAREPK
jgi:hypothetical protein